MIICNEACKEEYVPVVDEPEKTIVVNAILTDEPGPKTITLSYAMPFNQKYQMPVQNAEVAVYDKYGTKYIFPEADLGAYVSTEFYPDSGNSFRLQFKTKEGRTYISSVQAIQPKGKIDTIHGTTSTKTLKIEAYNTTDFRNETGIEFLTTMNLSKDNSPYYRFSNTMLIQYTTNDPTTSYLSFCWLTYSANDYFNLMSQENHSSNAQHVMGFVPSDLGYYGVVNQIAYYPPGSYFQGTYTIEKTVHSIQFSFKQFHINKDVFEYYQAINIQLQAKQMVFDPIVNQFRGNITCIENPKEVVLGVFEVASARFGLCCLIHISSTLIFMNSHTWILINCQYMNANPLNHHSGKNSTYETYNI